MNPQNRDIFRKPTKFYYIWENDKDTLESIQYKLFEKLNETIDINIILNTLNVISANYIRKHSDSNIQDIDVIVFKCIKELYDKYKSIQLKKSTQKNMDPYNKTTQGMFKNNMNPYYNGIQLRKKYNYNTTGRY